jgi:ComF family protein
VNEKSATVYVPIYNTLNTTMMILDTFLAHIAPHECVGCGTEGKLVCEACSSKLVQPAGRCYRCHRVSPEGRTCANCLRTSKLYAVTAVALYEDCAKDLVWRLKFGSARMAAREMAELMAGRYTFTGTPVLLVPVPTATSRIRRRGYDQARLLARELSRATRLPYCNCLSRLGQHQQVGASRERRLKQLAEAFRVSALAPIRGAHIILVDDVVTTGATLEAAAAVLKASGAKRVEAIVFARA